MTEFGELKTQQESKEQEAGSTAKTSNSLILQFSYSSAEHILALFMRFFSPVFATSRPCIW